MKFYVVKMSVNTSYVELAKAVDELAETINSILTNYNVEDTVVEAINKLINDINGFDYGQNFITYLTTIM